MNRELKKRVDKIGKDIDELKSQEIWLYDETGNRVLGTIKKMPGPWVAGEAEVLTEAGLQRKFIMYEKGWKELITIRVVHLAENGARIERKPRDNYLRIRPGGHLELVNEIVFNIPRPE